MMRRFDQAVIIALGSNMAGAYVSSQVLLEAALGEFEAAGLHLLRRSGWWRSAAWPNGAGPDYLNGLAIVETMLGPYETLRALLEIERRFGRQRDQPNDPRTLDLDLIAHGRAVLDTPELILPHPRAAERLFVMGPLAQVAPQWRHPRSGETAQALALAASIGRDATPL